MVKKIKLLTADKVSSPLGCMGSKKNEMKYLFPLILPHINNNITFVEPFCGSSVVSYNIYKQKPDAKYHINDIDEIRIDFYINMKDGNKRNELYKLEKNILKEGAPKYYEITKTNNKDYDSLYYKKIISSRIHSFRNGIFPTNKKIILHNISDDWINFFKNSNITNYDYKQIFKQYKDDENVFLYLDPPYNNSYNASYASYENKVDNNNNIIDNTIIYLDLLNLLNEAKCKVLFSINKNAITEYLYKDYIKYIYEYKYNLTHNKPKNETEEEIKKKGSRKKELIYIISNYNINELDNLNNITKYEIVV